VTSSPAPPAEPRLRMQRDRSGRTLLDGGWWPRSADPAAEAGNREHAPAILATIHEAAPDRPQPVA
jgi:Family of unknown function (DUF5994)